MANYSTNLKNWGSAGSEFPTGYSYEEGEQPVDEWDNFVTANAINDIEHLIDLTNSRIESDTTNNRPSSPEAGHQHYDGDTGILEWWDDVNSEWLEVLPKEGGKMFGTLDMSGNAIADDTGVLTVSAAMQIQNSRLDHNWMSNQQGGTIAIDGVVPISTFGLEDGEELYITRATLTEDGFTSPVANGVSMFIISESGNTVTVLSGDGSTLYDNETGDPINSYNNSTGSRETVMIAIDNGQYGAGAGDEVSAHGGYVARKQ